MGIVGSVRMCMYMYTITCCFIHLCIHVCGYWWGLHACVYTHLYVYRFVWEATLNQVKKRTLRMCLANSHDPGAPNSPQSRPVCILLAQKYILFSYIEPSHLVSVLGPLAYERYVTCRLTAYQISWVARGPKYWPIVSPAHSPIHRQVYIGATSRLPQLPVFKYQKTANEPIC